MSDQGDDAADDPPEARARADDHLQDVPDGCGCAEMWEHTSEERAD